MKRAYNIPMLAGESFMDYSMRVTSLPITFESDARNVTIPGDGYVELEGSISGQEEIPVRGT